MSKLLIMVGTETGTAEGVAKYLQKSLQSEHSVEVTLDASTADLLRDPEEILVICSSNTGAGDVPANIEPLYDAMRSEAPDLKGRQYLLLNLGDSMYSTFGEAGEKWQQIMSKLGAEPMAESLLVDTGEERYPQKLALNWLQESLAQ